MQGDINDVFDDINSRIKLNKNALCIDFPTLCVDKNLHYVGIGTSTPKNLLDLWISGVSVSSIDVNGNFYGNTTLFNYGTSSLPSYSFNGQTNLGMYRSSPNTLGFSTSGNLAVIIDSSGNVGINRSDPANIVGSTAGGFVIKDGSRAGTTAFVAFQDSSANNLYSLTENGTHIFKHGSSTSLTLDSSGNVNVQGATNFQVQGSQVYPVVQIVSATGATSTGYTNAAFITTAVTVNITPKFTTSKILIQLTCAAANGAGGTVSWTLERNASNLLSAADGFWRSAAGATILLNYSYYDSPASTSAQTYALYVKPANGTTIVPNNETWSIVCIEYAQ